jgi:hypothetical protein
MSLTDVAFDIEIDTTRPAPPEGTALATLESWGESRTFTAKNPTPEAEAYLIEKAMFRVEGTDYNTLAGIETMLLPYDLWITLDSDLKPSAAKTDKGPVNWKIGAFFKAFGKSVKGSKLSDLVGGQAVITIKPEMGQDGQPTGYAKVTSVKKP